MWAGIRPATPRPSVKTDPASCPFISALRQAAERRRRNIVIASDAAIFGGPWPTRVAALRSRFRPGVIWADCETSTGPRAHSPDGPATDPRIGLPPMQDGARGTMTCPPSTWLSKSPSGSTRREVDPLGDFDGRGLGGRRVIVPRAPICCIGAGPSRSDPRRRGCGRGSRRTSRNRPRRRRPGR